VGEAAVAEVLELPRRRSPLRAALAALRPRQWTKNLLVFAGLVFAAKLGDGWRWLEALTAFAAYCAASSAAYLGNDVRDVAADRLHPAKRRRPIARGELSRRRALVLAGALVCVAVCLAATLGPASLACLLGFLGLQAAYSLRLKVVVLVDVIAIAGLFVVRAVAGAVAVDVRLSPWLPVCAGLLALMLALGKRRAELGSVGSRSRVALEGYTMELLDQLLVVTAAATMGAYVVYTLTARDSKVLVLSIPFVVYGVFRYLLLVHRRGAGEEPESVFLRDRPLLVAVAMWVAVCAVVLAR
jgi:4-hydroxybenzoate polyprenyltransferase